MYHSFEIKEVLESLETSREGLTEHEVDLRLEKYGLNEIKKTKKLQKLKIFLRQFLDPLIIILIAAILISLLIKQFIDASVIFAILMLNAIFGFSQEYKAEKAIALLKKLSSIKSKVIRNNKKVLIDSKYLVPGDILILETGDKIPADARLIEYHSLLVDESTLTGESMPSEKSTKSLKKETPLAEQTNMVFSGTLVTSGRAKGIVAKTGMRTELGKIAKLVEQEDDTKTPLQQRLMKLGKFIGVVIVFMSFLILLIGVIKNLDFFEMFLIALSLAVSAIPEGLPAVITITLAFGVRAMLKRKALIRRLKAIETLGSVTTIAVDKTGTLTENEMTVSELFVNNKTIKVTGKGYEIKGDFYFNNRKISPTNFKLLLEVGASCNNANLPNIGDPTELALLVSASKANIKKIENRISEQPFSPEKKYMVTTHYIDGKKNSYIKGAPENVLKICNFIKINNTIKRLTKKEKTLILQQNTRMAKNALRVLAMAYQDGKKTIFVGLQGMQDPPRKEVKTALEICKKAGIDVIMITGDNKTTALAIAKKINLNSNALEGIDLDKIDDKQLRETLKTTKIFARVNPEHKVRILKILQKNREVVAMTGDGINDAPALKKADVGVAMSIKGTDVAREASDMVLLDDNFNSIVSAVKEGRIIYDNIKKFIKFLLSVNFSEIGLVLFAILSGLPLPLLPLQILWINLVTDSLPALSLSKEPGEKNTMLRKPRNQKESILKNTRDYIIIGGILAFAVELTVFLLEFFSSANLEKARTLTLTTGIIFEMFFIFSCRSDESIFKIGIFSNRYLVGAVLITIILQLIVLYTPLGILFRLVPLGLEDWVKVILLSCVGFVFFEVRKLIRK